MKCCGWWAAASAGPAAVAGGGSSADGIAPAARNKSADGGDPGFSRLNIPFIMDKVSAERKHQDLRYCCCTPVRVRTYVHDAILQDPDVGRRGL